MSENSAKSDKKRQQGRSPAYPSVALKEALEKAQAQYEAEGKYPAPLSSAFKAWGYSAKSSGGRDVRASLRYFGLITVEGDGDQATVKLTEDALRVITDKREDQSEKRALIRRLALNPTAHKKLWAKYPEGIVSEASAAHYLQWNEGFNESAAEALVAEFKSTAAFAGLYEPDAEMVIEPPLEDEGDQLDRPGVDASRGGDLPRERPPTPRAQVAVVGGERVAFIEEGQPGQYLKLIACGAVDDFMLEALEDYVKRQRKRLGRSAAPQDNRYEGDDEYGSLG